MDKELVQRIRNNNARLIDSRDRFHVNEVRFDTNSSKQHKKEILKLVEKAIDMEHNFLTRAHIDTTKKTDRLCADFIDLDHKVVIEVAFSEDDKSLERKKTVWENLGFVYETKRIERQNAQR